MVYYKPYLLLRTQILNLRTRLSTGLNLIINVPFYTELSWLLDGQVVMCVNLVSDLTRDDSLLRRNCMLQRCFEMWQHYSNLRLTFSSLKSGADLGGGCRGCAPPPLWDDLRFSNTSGFLQKKKLCGLLVLKKSKKRVHPLLNKILDPPLQILDLFKDLNAKCYKLCLTLGL